MSTVDLQKPISVNSVRTLHDTKIHCESEHSLDNSFKMRFHFRKISNTNTIKKP